MFFWQLSVEKTEKLHKYRPQKVYGMKRKIIVK